MMKNGKYAVLNSHMRGASHVAKGLGCEDFSDSYLDDRIAIAVISDGHGDKNCFRSAKGAEYACQAAISTVKQISDFGELMESPDRVITEIEKCIILSWNDLVLKDVTDNPIQESELEGLADDAVAMLKDGRRLQKIYGCTLIMSCVLDGFWFAIQVGDGKCVCVSDNGMYSQPIPWDNVGCVGNRSTSICDSRAFDNFRYIYSKEVPVASFVASDGVDESFDENGLNKCYYSMAAWAKSLDDDELSTNFTQLLEKISNGGSGDDVSIAGIVSIQKEVKKPVATSEQVAIKMEEILNTLKEIENRYVELRDRDYEINSEISSIEEKIKELESEIEEKKKSINEKIVERDSVRRSFSSITSQYREISDQFKVAKERKKQVDDYWRGLGASVTDTSKIEEYEPIKIECTEACRDNEEKKEVAADEQVVSKPVEVNESEHAGEPVPLDHTDVGEAKQMEVSENQDTSSDKKEEKMVESEKTENYKRTGLFGNLFKKE